MLRLITQHSLDFDILSSTVDHSRSPYFNSVEEYVAKLKAFYAELGVAEVLWTSPEDEPRDGMTVLKPAEYLLEVDESRVVAYVDELSWSPYVTGETDAPFRYSRSPERYGVTSILIAMPLRREEVIEYRRYQIDNPDRFYMIERKRFAHVLPAPEQ